MIRVLIADSDPACRERLRAALADDPELEVVGLARDGHEAVQWAHARRPDIALLADTLAVRDGFQTAEVFVAAGLPIQSILLLEQNDLQEIRRAMRAGARECLVHTAPAAELRDTIQSVFAEGKRRQTAAFAEAADPRRAARIFAVSGAKGGIGKTTVAVNLAVALARETGEPTVLVDLYTQFGDAATLLNLAPRRALSDLARLNPADLDERVLEDHLESHPSGLRLLTGSSLPLPFDLLTPVFLDRILGLLKHNFRFIVLDVPPFLHPATLHVLSAATAVLLIANLYDLTTMHDSRLWLDAVEGKHAAREAVQIVLNRVSRRNRLQIPDVERALGRPVQVRIPNDGRIVPGSVNAGIPFVLSHPNSPVSRSIKHLACTLAEWDSGNK